jgi:single-strand DNA-binding protein
MKMPKSLNKVILIGNVGKDPEMRYSPSGLAIATFSMATSESWKDKDTGDKKEKTEWHKIVAFGKTAEIIGQYNTKGDFLYIEGKIQTRDWEDKDGVKRYTTEIVAQYTITLRSKNGPKSEDGQQSPMGQTTSVPEDDDIPF